MMRRTVAAILSSVVLSLAAAAQAHAQADDAPAWVSVVRAKAELNEGARAYKDGRFADAEQHFRRALELDPTQKNAPLFIARAVQRQYKNGDASPENVATGERAIAAYQVILDRDPQNEDAYKAVVFLYGQLKREDKVVEVLTARANDYMVPNEQRSQTFVILASRKWQCSYEVTGPEEKWAKGNARRPRLDAGDLITARQCVDEGMGLIEQAASLDPNGPLVWAYKAHLLREASKLAEAEGDAERRADYYRQYEEALDAQKRVTAESERKEREGRKMPARQTPPAPPSDHAPDPTPRPGGAS